MSSSATSRTTPISTTPLSDDSECPLYARFECPICINWLNEPVLTTCGHRFCKSCIRSWLEKKSQCCPLDNIKLSIDDDVFPDNYTRREICQIKWKCPNTPLGCKVISSPIDIEKHLAQCSFKLPSPVKQKCPFVSVKCGFVARDEGPSVQEHIDQCVGEHLNLILDAVQENTFTQWSPQKVNNGHLASALPPPPAQYANEADENLIAAMYQRIVVLEQRCREQDVKIENLTKQLTTQEKTSEEHTIDPYYSNGIIIWELANFCSLLEAMRMNPNTRFYSRECYTSPHGYKFCARISVYRQQHLSLHVHLMQSENDFHLDWPFSGRLKFYMIHPRDQSHSQCDTIMSKSDALAFHRPTERMNPRGFGFLEYATIADIIGKGFIENDRLVIKIQVNIV